MNKRFSFFILLIFLTSCIAEYDDGPFISFKSHKARLHGTWELEHLFIDGTDSTWYTKNQQCYQPMKFLSDEDAGGLDNLIPQNPTKCGLRGTYSLTDDKDYLKFGFDENPGTLVPVGPLGKKVIGGQTWKITKLSSEKLWLEIIYNNMFCWMHLKKI